MVSFISNGTEWIDVTITTILLSFGMERIVSLFVALRYLASAGGEDYFFFCLYIFKEDRKFLVSGGFQSSWLCYYCTLQYSGSLWDSFRNQNNDYLPD